MLRGRVLNQRGQPIRNALVEIWQCDCFDGMISTLMRWWAILALFRVAATGDTFSVTNSADAGPGTLREAITRANAASGTHRIAFALPDVGDKPILLTSFLPTITNGMVIDGWTQIGSRPNSHPSRNNSVVLIQLLGGGINIDATGVTIRGLAFRNSYELGSIRFSGGSNNVVEGCTIGTDSTGKFHRGSGLGISINNSSFNRIGGTNVAERNLIGFNNGAGVFIRDGTNNSVHGNLIFANRVWSIRLGLASPNKNDAGDVDTGPNQLQNFPDLAAVRWTAGGLLVDGSLSGRTNKTYRLEFFGSPACVVSNYAMARDFVGWTNLTIGSNSVESFSVQLIAPVAPGHFVTATATDDAGNTSEFSPCVALPALQYVATPVGSLGNSFAQGNRLNNRGDVVGYAFVGKEGTNTHAFLYSEGTMKDLGTLGGFHSFAWSINDRTEVVGESEVAGQKFHAFLWRNGAMEDLGTIPGRDESLATDINNRGQIVGYASIRLGGQNRAFLWENGVMTDIGTLPGHGGAEAWALNEQGDILGVSWEVISAQGTPGPRRPFLRRNGQMLPITELPELYAFPARLNERRDLVVTARPGDGANHGFSRVGGDIFDWGQFANLYGRGNDINESGISVGAASSQDGIPNSAVLRPVIYREGEIFDLNAITADLPPGLLKFAMSINDEGVILANDSGNESLRTFQLTPGGENRTNVYLLHPLRFDAERMGTDIRFSWNAALSGFHLQTATDLARPDGWVDVSGTASALGNILILTHQPADAVRFYRLFRD